VSPERLVGFEHEGEPHRTAASIRPSFE